MIDATVDTSDVDAGIRAVESVLRDATRPMAEIGRLLEADIALTFAANGARDGRSAWPLSERARIRKGRTLVDTGRLRDSLVTGARTTPTSAEIVSDVDYADAVNASFPVLFVSEAAAQKAEDILGDAVVAAWEGP